MDFKDGLWAIFRTQAAHQSIKDQIEAKISEYEDENDMDMDDDAMTQPESQDEFENYYHDFFSLADYKDLKQKLLNEMPDVAVAYEDYFQKYDCQDQHPNMLRLSWYDKLQKLIIKTYLLMSEDRNRNLNLFAQGIENMQMPIIQFLDESTDIERQNQLFERTGVQITEEELQHRLFFAANYLLVLRAQGRIRDDPECISSYNLVMERFVKSLGDSIISPTSTSASGPLSQNTQATVEMLAFYVAVGTLGADNQMAQYAFFMLDVKDDAIQDQVLHVNHGYFKRQMLEQLYHFRLLMGIYGHHERIRYRQMLVTEQVRSQEVDIHGSLSSQDKGNNSMLGAAEIRPEDQEAIDSFKWIFKQRDMDLAQFTKALEKYNELIRKFLIEGKLTATHALINQYEKSCIRSSKYA